MTAYKEHGRFVYTDVEERHLDQAENRHIRHMYGELDTSITWPVWSQTSRDQWLDEHGENEWEYQGEDE